MKTNVVRYCGICIKSNKSGIEVGLLYLLELDRRRESIHVFNMNGEYICKYSKDDYNFIIVTKLPNPYTGADKCIAIFARYRPILDMEILYQILYINNEFYIDMGGRPAKIDLYDQYNEYGGYDFVTIDEDVIKPSYACTIDDYIKEYTVQSNKIYLSTPFGDIPFDYPVKEVYEPDTEILRNMAGDRKEIIRIIKKSSRSSKKNNVIVEAKVQEVDKMNANNRVYKTTKRDNKIKNTHLLSYNKRIRMKDDKFPNYRVHEINTVEDEYLVYRVDDIYLTKAAIYTKDELEEKFDCENLNNECITLKAKCIKSHTENNGDYIAKGASYNLILTARIAAVNTGMDNLAIFRYINEDNKYDCLFEYFVVDVYYKNGETEKYLYTINDDENLHHRYLYNNWESDEENADRIEEAKEMMKMIKYKDTIKIECLETGDYIALSSNIPTLLYSRKTFKRVAKYLAKMMSSNRYWLTFRCDISEYCKPLIIKNDVEYKSDTCESSTDKNIVIFEHFRPNIVVKAESTNSCIVQQLNAFYNVIFKCLKDIFPELEELNIHVESAQ